MVLVKTKKDGGEGGSVKKIQKAPLLVEELSVVAIPPVVIKSRTNHKGRNCGSIERGC